MSTSQKLQLSLFGIFVLALGAVFVIQFQARPGWDFRNNLWAPAHLMVHHQSPYNVKLLFENSNAVWMPMVIGLFFPLGMIPLQQASNLWLLLNVGALFLLVAFSASGSRLKPGLLALLVLCMAVFPANTSGLVLGQVSLMICVGLTAVIFYDDRLPPPLIGLLLVFSLAKPQVSYLFILSYLVLTFKDRGLRNSLRIAGWIGLWIVVTCLPLFLFYPSWPVDFLSNLQGNSAWLQPTIASWLYARLQWGQLFFRGIFFFAGLLIIFPLSLKLPKQSALLWALAITPVFSPYIWTWDFIFLFPLFLHTCASRGLPQRAILAGGFLLCLAVSLGMELTGHVAGELFWWVAPVLLISILLVR